MTKLIIFCIYCLFFSIPAYAQTTNPDDTLTLKELERKNKLELIAKERSEETGRFSRKAIERAKARERRELEKQYKRAEKASRFQKEALKKETQKAVEQKNLTASAEKSRFAKKAEERAAKRAQKEQKKLDRKRNRSRYN